MKKFKNLLKQYKLDGYIIPKNDEYFNEYVSSAKDRLKFISNFSGSAGFAVILKNKNYLFVDGRYTIQARIQSGKSFKVITIPKKFPKDVLKFNKKLTIGFDPRLHTESKLNFLFNIKNISLKSVNKNLVDIVWSKRPKELIKPFYSLSKKNTGISSEEKILEVKKFFNKDKVDYLLVTAPENIAWILNIRGHDSIFSPIPNARLLMNKNGDIHFFANPKKITIIKKSLPKKIIFHEENKIEKILTNLYKNKIFLDSLSCSIYYKNLLKKKNIIIEKIDPIHFFKSIKNITEIKNMKKSHLSDGAALTKFLFWVKKNFRKKKITELFAQKKLENFRKMNKSYKFPSFNTISGSGPNTAIIHYRASPKTNRSLRKGDLYLVDSGGQYSFGTTDVTRTISLDNKSNYIKEIYTRVLKGHIAVSNFPLKKNSTGSKVDQSARKFLKKIKLDYPHGTGHGVGYFLNVHEGPQSFSKNNKVNLRDGMIISNEPGYYKEGSFGIRIENLIYINQNKFEELTMVPIEKDLINKKMLNKNEINWINKYHSRVRKNLLKFMSFQEKVDLTKACSPI
ncbi:MAG: aminopeptidase P family protein [Pelagibacteraceae bacterium]|nr:aminopeptidase P family protein [Pelagibacteraceae bacterium]